MLVFIFIYCYTWSVQEVKALAKLYINTGLPESPLLTYMIIRDYLTALSPKVSTRDPIISLRALARGLMMVKVCY